MNATKVACVASLSALKSARFPHTTYFYEGYVVEVPKLPGCVSQGKTLDEAIENIKDAIKGYLHVQAMHLTV